MVAIQHQDQYPLYMNESEYLAFEYESEIKHEFVNGKVYAMSGGSARHSFITVNTSTAFNVQLANTDCRVASPDLRLKVQSKVAHRYPDVMVICGELDYVDNRNDTVQNPIVIVEVLSPSTERHDRGRKFQDYRDIQSLQEYVLISQNNPRIERFTRQNDVWVFADARRLDETIELSSIACVINLADVYRKVSFEVDE